MASTESIEVDELEFHVWHSHVFTKTVRKSNQNSSRKMWAFGKKQVGVKIVNSLFYLIYFLSEIPDFFFGEANEASLHEQHTP